MSTGYKVEAVPETRERELQDKSDGPAAAAIVAAGVGIFTLGLVTVLSEASVMVHDFLESMDFGRGVGPLAGKTILASAAFFVSWGILGYLWKAKDQDIKRMFWIGMGLGIVGAVMTLPPVFTAFG